MLGLAISPQALKPDALVGTLSLGKLAAFLNLSFLLCLIEIAIPYHDDMLLQKLIEIKYIKNKSGVWHAKVINMASQILSQISAMTQPPQPKHPFLSSIPTIYIVVPKKVLVHVKNMVSLTVLYAVY